MTGGFGWGVAVPQHRRRDLRLELRHVGLLPPAVPNPSHHGPSLSPAVPQARAGVFSPADALVDSPAAGAARRPRQGSEQAVRGLGLVPM
jgi:hypothetical protein